MVQKILAFGEILWDLLPSGKQIGGAPGNFIYHCRQWGADARIVTRIGKDALGDEARETLCEKKIPIDFLQVDSSLPTGTVAVELNAGQPSYRIVENVAWDRILPEADPLEFAAEADAFCFGSLALRSEENRRSLRLFLDALSPKAKVIFDLNLRAPFYSWEVLQEFLPRADIFKLNDDELLELARLMGVSLGEAPFFIEKGLLSPSRQAFVDSLIADNSLELLVLTCGAQGSCLYDRQKNSSFVAPVPVSVVSTVGAGDAFTAVTAVGFLKGMSLDEINHAASRYAALVCTQPGGMPDLSGQFPQ